jgi:hypothetical protein
VVALIVRQGIALTDTGAAIGAVAAFALSRFVASILYQVNLHDPRIFVGSIAVLAIVALGPRLDRPCAPRRSTRSRPFATNSRQAERQGAIRTTSGWENAPSRRSMRVNHSAANQLEYPCDGHRLVSP